MRWSGAKAAGDNWFGMRASARHEDAIARRVALPGLQDEAEEATARKQPEPLPSPPKKKKENRAHSKEERKDREELEALVVPAVATLRGGMAPADR